MQSQIQWPWFIGFFCLAAVCNTYLPAGAPVYAVAGEAGEDRVDRNAVSDRKRDFDCDREASGASPADAGNYFVAAGIGDFVVADLRWLDWALTSNEERSGSFASLRMTTLKVKSSSSLRSSDNA